MIWHDLQLGHLAIKRDCVLKDQFFEPVGYGASKDFAPILWAPNQMVSARIHYMIIAFASHAY